MANIEDHRVLLINEKGFAILAIFRSDLPPVQLEIPYLIKFIHNMCVSLSTRTGTLPASYARLIHSAKRLACHCVSCDSAGRSSCTLKFAATDYPVGHSPVSILVGLPAGARCLSLITHRKTRRICFVFQQSNKKLPLGFLECFLNNRAIIIISEDQPNLFISQSMADLPQVRLSVLGSTSVKAAPILHFRLSSS
jgi:hypothetical protein